MAKGEEKRYLLALDQGTTSSRAVLFDTQGRIVSMAQKDFKQYYPQPGWVEHDPSELWGTQLGVAQEVLEKTGVSPSEVAALGITNQRETTLVWERETGKPVYPAIVWQCRRTAQLCEAVKRAGHEAYIRTATGLVVDAYFSATKIRWILDEVPGAREKAQRGELCFGTVDTWLIYNLTRGRVHATDVSNASRTLLFNLDTLAWDSHLLEIFDIPESMMPEIRPSAGLFGWTDPSVFGGIQLQISGVAGDQQAALFGQRCFEPGEAKNTYGTGCFILMNTGNQRVVSESGLLTTVAWGLKEGKATYALEGSIFIGGAAVQWLRDELQLIRTAPESEEIARRVEDTGGVYVVPAFTGLGAPYWDMYARGAIVGLTRGSGRDQIVRATLEAIAYQTRDVVEAMSGDAGMPLCALKADGGATGNEFLMQFQADLLGVSLDRPEVMESTALGAALLAGLGAGVYGSLEEIKALNANAKHFEPHMEAARRDALYAGWRRAVKQVRSETGAQ
ncbi:glycerol kinase GlpK [Acidaminobacter hydrogenoformans]